MTLQRKYHRVYTKSTWSEDWQYRPYWEALSASVAAPPAIGMAYIRYRYGSGQEEDGAARIRGEHIENLGNKYVAITQCDDAAGSQEKFLFIGIVPEQEFVPLGLAEGVKTIDQTVKVLGIEYLLSRDKIYGAFITNDGSVPQYIDVDVEYNNRLQDGRIEGNRSKGLLDYPGDVKAYAFDARKESRQVWSVWDILRTEIKLNHPSIEPKFVFPASYYLLQGSRPAEIDALDKMKMVFKDGGKSVWQVLNELIVPERGMRFGLCVNRMTGHIEIRIWSILEEAAVIGDITIPAHDSQDRMSPDLWQTLTEVPKIERADSHYDRIIVRGQPIKVCGTFYAGGSINDLVKGWTHTEVTDQEQLYKDASKTATDYGSLSDDAKKILNDTYRASALFDRVWTCFTVPKDWDWKVAATQDILNPYFDWDTGEFDLQKQGAYWNGQKRFLPYLPFKEGWDYSGASPIDKTPYGGEEQYRKILALGLNNNSKWVDLSKCPHAANVQAMEGQLGVAIRFNPAHLLAKNNWSGAQPSTYDDNIDEFGFDWESLMVTAMLESDQMLAIRKTLRDGGNMLELVIDVPWAELWRVDPLTIIDVDKNGQPVFFGAEQESCIRDDRDILRQILAAACAFYGRAQYKMALSTSDLDLDIGLGMMMMGLDVENATPSRGGCISSIAWDFLQQTMGIWTESAELNVKAIIGMGDGVTGASRTGLRRGSKEISEVRKSVQQLRQEVAVMAKQRPSQGGGGGDETIWARVIVELLNPDAERETLPEGVAEYVMRLASDTTAAYNAASAYVVGSQVIGSDNRKYTSRTGTAQAPNTGNNPVVTPAATTTHWTLELEINPRAAGWESGSDMRHFLQRFLVGAYVPLIMRSSLYLIEGMVYIGSGNSLMSNDNGRAMAVYAG